MYVLNFVNYLVCYRPQVSSALFFQYNTQLGPPYHILIDTNFINFSVKYKLDIIQNMMDCLYAKCELIRSFYYNLFVLKKLCFEHFLENLQVFLTLPTVLLENWKNLVQNIKSRWKLLKIPDSKECSACTPALMLTIVWLNELNRCVFNMIKFLFIVSY